MQAHAGLSSVLTHTGKFKGWPLDLHLSHPQLLGDGGKNYLKGFTRTSDST